MHCCLKAPAMPFLSFNDYEEMYGIEFPPSRHLAAAIFLVGFWNREKLYIREMSKTTEDKEDGCLCCEHTFASVSEYFIIFYIHIDENNNYYFPCISTFNSYVVPCTANA